MKISIQFKDLQVTASDRQRIEEGIRLALTRFAPLVRGLSATISDENGSRGGADKRCRLVVRLHAATVVVTEQASAVMAAVTRAAERAARSVARVHHRAIDARQTAPSGRGRRHGPLERVAASPTANDGRQPAGSGSAGQRARPS